jgi:hypothetical protein
LYTGIDWKLTVCVDPSEFAERRMQMGKRVLWEQDIQIHESPSGLCEEEGCFVSACKAAVQGR